MAIDEDTRYRLHQTFDDLIGADMATALMENLPPAGWGDVLRQSDLEQFELRMDLRFEASEQRLRAELHEQIGLVHQEIGSVHHEIGSVHHEIGLLRQEFAVQTRSFLLAFLGTVFTLCAVLIAAKLL